jgi:excisionase family DNA binding protein
MATVTKFGALPATQRSARLLTPDEASEFLSVPIGTLNQWRSQRRGPSYIKFEGRLVRYRATDLEKYVASCVVETEEEKR